MDVKCSSEQCETTNLLTSTLRSFIVSLIIKLLAYDPQHPTPRLRLFSPNPSTASFSQFQSVTVHDVIAAVRALPDKTCALDPLPTTHLKAVVGVIAPFLTSLFNKSLFSGYFSDAYITPLVKNLGMDTADVRLYRPMSNVSVASKLLEQIAAKQLIAYLEKSALQPRLQPA